MLIHREPFLRRFFHRAQQLFHLLIGIVFLFMTMAGVTVSMKLWQDYQQVPGQGIWSFGLVVTFTALLFVFCLYSFAKARSVR